MESIHCYNLGDKSYAKALLEDKKHWVRSLPGKLLHNIISHGISKIAEFLPGDDPKVIAYGFTSPILKSINETDIIDELRVIIVDNDNTTGYFTFSTQISPVVEQFRLFGSKNALLVDIDHRTLIKIPKQSYKSYMRSFIPPWKTGKEYFSNATGNIMKFVKREMHVNYGMNYLIKSFYRSVTENDPVPIPYREIILVSRIMDSIFSQLLDFNKRPIDV